MTQPRKARETALQALQELWDAKLREAGFVDAEDRQTGLLKHWSGVSNLTDNLAGALVVPTFAAEEAFMHGPYFARAVEAVGRARNRLLDVNTIRQIWALYVSGMPLRAIGEDVSTSKDTVWRVCSALTEAMHLMGGSVNEEKNVKIVLRSREPGDDGFIYATWRNALWYDNKKDNTRAPQFYKDASHYIKILLASPTTVVRIACLSDDANHIVGYSVLSTSNLEWVYVKIDYRKQGVATLLCKGATSASTPRTKIGMAIVEKKGLKTI